MISRNFIHLTYPKLDTNTDTEKYKVFQFPRIEVWNIRVSMCQVKCITFLLILHYKKLHHIITATIIITLGEYLVWNPLYYQLWCLARVSVSAWPPQQQYNSLEFIDKWTNNGVSYVQQNKNSLQSSIERESIIQARFRCFSQESKISNLFTRSLNLYSRRLFHQNGFDRQ